MKIDNILIDYVNRGSYPRTVGRYWASELWSIKKGYTSARKFFKKENKIGIYGVRMILTGIANEDMLTKIFDEMNVKYKPQEKKEILVDDDITLVVKPDFIFKDFVIETKYPFGNSNDIPERYLYQLEAEYRSFYLPVYLGKFKSPFEVKLLEYTPSKSRWREIQEMLREFHLKVKKYEKNNATTSN